MNKRELLRFAAAALLFAAAPRANAQQYGWVRVAQIGNPNTNALRAVEFVDSLHGWASGNALYRTTDGGINWSAFGVPFVANAISMFDTMTGFASGQQSQDGRIYKTTNGGVSWSSQLFRISNPYIGSATLSVSDNITSGYRFSPDTGKIVQTTNGGATWTERTFGDSIFGLTQVQFVDSLHGWIIYNGSGLLKTTDGGNTFTAHRFPVQSPAFHFLNTTLGYMVTYTSTYCYKTTDAGASWTRLGRIYDPQWDDLIATSVSFVDSLNGWVFGYMFYQGDLTGMIYKTTDGGVSWIREFVAPVRRIAGLMVDRFHGWSVGEVGSVFAYRLLTSVPEQLSTIPIKNSLRQNHPNPFNPTTTIEYEVVEPAHVSIKLYDINGKETRILVESEHKPGVYRIRFDATGLASGVYLYTLRAGKFSETQRMLLVR